MLNALRQVSDYADTSEMFLEWKLKFAKYAFNNSTKLRGSFYELFASYLEDEGEIEALKRIHVSYLPTEDTVTPIQELSYGLHPVSIAVTDWLKTSNEDHMEFHELIEGWVPPLELSLIEVSSQSDNMQDTLLDLMKTTERENSTVATFFDQMKSGLLWFSIVAFGYWYVGNSRTFVGLLNMVRNSKNVTPEMADFIGKVDFIDVWGFPLVSLSLILIALFQISIQWLIGDIRDWLDQHTPIYNLYCKMETARFLKIFQKLLESKLEETKALEKIANLDGQNKWLKDKLAKAISIINTNSCNTPKSFQFANHGFPDRVTLHDLAFYAERTGWIKKLGTIANRTQKSALRTAKTLGWIINIIFWVLMTDMLMSAAVFMATLQNAIT